MIEGKTKIIRPLFEGSAIGLVTTKDDITAGDGAKHDIIPGKAALATRTTCNIFEVLRDAGVPVAYVGRDSPTTFLTLLCTMIPVEVVVRRVAMGSYLKRHPHTGADRFERPVVEFFYKTTERSLNGQTLPCDDPLMLRTKEGWDLYYPNRPPYIGRICALTEATCGDMGQFTATLEECGVIALDAFTALEREWQFVGGTLQDFKVECGMLPDKTVVVADVIDCDSWRVEWNGLQLSKQGYREGDDLDRVLGVYRIAAALTDSMAR